ncbi:hypothetical protein NDU88_003621 [Pleurodeles waltl]|uniref:Uncharacterized protein n=1 Tax=Pleurodeles waltl TaxID=8319 RepID=A0AAV7LHK6_PLEWA|nr:hypothetical protein NDU88_003621 [Pleurodeles waltl]
MPTNVANRSSQLGAVSPPCRGQQNRQGPVGEALVTRRQVRPEAQRIAASMNAKNCSSQLWAVSLPCRGQGNRQEPTEAAGEALVMRRQARP